MVGKWVSIYFDEEEVKILDEIMRRVRERGKKVSRYALLKSWILRVFKLIEEGDASWLELDHEPRRRAAVADLDPLI